MGSRRRARPDAAIHGQSSEVAVKQWLQALLTAAEYARLSCGGVDGAKLLRCRGVREIASLLSTDESVAETVRVALGGASGLQKLQTDPDSDDDVKIVKAEPDLEDALPEALLHPHAKLEPPAAAVKAEHLAAIKRDPHSDSEGGLARDESNDENVANASDRHRAHQAAAGGPDVADDSGDGGSADEAEAEADDDDDDFDMEVDPHEPRPEVARHVVEIEPVQPVKLPTDPAAREMYINKALCGFAYFLDDFAGAVKKPLIEVTGWTTKQPSDHTKDRALCFAWCILSERIRSAMGSQLGSTEKLEELLTKLKELMRSSILRDQNRRNKKSKKGSLALQRCIPYSTTQAQIEQEAGDGSNDTTIIDVEVLDVKPDVVETLWSLWQALPYVGTFALKVKSGGPRAAACFKGTHLLSAPHMCRALGIACDEQRSQRSRLKARDGDANASVVYDALRWLGALVDRRVSVGTRGWLLPYLSLERDGSGGEDDCILTVRFFLEAGMVGESLDKGLSGFVQLEETDSQLPELLLMMEEHKETAVATKLHAWFKERDVLHRRLARLAVEPHEAMDGGQFRKLIAMVSDTVEEIPADLEEEVLPVLTVQPTKYQLASLGFLRKEEHCAAGIQRHYWWPLTLPGGPELLCYMSPYFNALWWATDAEHLHHWDQKALRPLNITQCRNSEGYTLFTNPKPRGGMLALEMGLGKTLVVIAAHSLQQHTIPEDWPLEQTELTEEQLEASETVYVGKDEDNLKEWEMYGGFKQADDGKGTIVPSGELRYVARGNLVVCPPTLAMQWAQEIERLTTQNHKVVVLDEIKTRRFFMSTREGLRELATYDWVITTPGKAVKDIDMLKALTWRRVIADEAHQLNARTGPVKGLTAAQREAQFMLLLASVEATQGHWCLTGTPLRNYKQASSMDRILGFLHTGLLTKEHMTNGAFVDIISRIAIRFTKEGNFKGVQNLKLPPLTERVKFCELTQSDQIILNWVKQKKVNDTGIRQHILEQQVKYNDAQAGLAVDDEDSEDDVEGEVAVIRRKERKGLVMKMLNGVIDPVRRVLSTAQELYLPIHDGHVAADEESLIIGLPEECKKPRTKRGEEPMDPREWKELKAQRMAKYQQIYVSGKLDALIADMRDIMAKADDNERSIKIIVYSNFDKSFDKVEALCNAEQWRFRSLKGGMSMKKRAAALEEFRNDDDMHIFLLNKACGAVGVNLTVATHVLIMEPSWNPVWEEQAVSRAHRMGQTGPIEVVRYIVKHSVEQNLRELMQRVSQADDGRAAELWQATDNKKTFESDEKALNEAVANVFKEQDLAMIIGELDADSAEEEEDDDDDDESDEE